MGNFWCDTGSWYLELWGAFVGGEAGRGGNMEQGGGSRPTFPVTGDDPHYMLSLPALAKSSDWVDQFRVKFLGSVQVPYHKGNDVLCAAMQKVTSHPSPGSTSTGSRQQGRASVGREGKGKGEPSSLLTSAGALSLCLPPQIATTRRLTVHFNPPSSCVLEISVRGVKIAVKADDSKENSKVAPCSLLVLSLLWLLTPAPVLQAMFAYENGDLHPSKSVRNTIDGVVDSPSGSLCLIGS